MENNDKTINPVSKAAETLTKELENLSPEELHEFFRFFYKLNHIHGNTIYLDQFEEFLGSFDSNPFKVNEDKKFKKQFIDAVIKYTFDHMGLITAAMLIKKKFTVEEIIQNYYASVDLFDGGWY